MKCKNVSSSHTTPLVDDKSCRNWSSLIIPRWYHHGATSRWYSRPLLTSYCRVLLNAGEESWVLAQLVSDTVGDCWWVLASIGECWRLQPSPHTTNGPLRTSHEEYERWWYHDGTTMSDCKKSILRCNLGSHAYLWWHQWHGWIVHKSFLKTSARSLGLIKQKYNNC